jgi:Tat protein translocase TatB subunit
MSFIGTQELLMILLIALLVVGPKRLPDLAKNLGKGLRNFKKATEKMRTDLAKNGAMNEIHELKEQVQDLQDEIRPLRGQFTDSLRNLMTPDDSAPAGDMTSGPAGYQEPPPSSAKSDGKPEQAPATLSACSDIPASRTPLGFDFPADNSGKINRE